jgi:uncharacterized membrane protein YkvA (DUF1232 family)
VFEQSTVMRWLLSAAAAYLCTWPLLVVLAHRLPAGLLREVAEFLPACVTAARRLRQSPAVPRRAKVALLVAVLWVLSPIDLIPEFLPVIGPLDDVVAVVLLLRYAAKSIPRPVLLEAWPGEPRLLLRLLDGRRAGTPAAPQAALTVTHDQDGQAE